MRRRHQGIQHTDCTARVIFGRRNRYAFAATAITGTPAVDNEPASRAPKSGNGGLFSEVGAERLNSSRRSCVIYSFSAVPHPFFHFRKFNSIASIKRISEGLICPPPHNPVRRSFTKGYVFESIDRIVVYNYLSQNLSTLGGPAAQFGAAECGSVSVQRRSVAPFSDLSYNSRIIAGVSQLAEINRYATSAVQFGAAELCNSVLYLLPMRSISAPQTIYSIMELLAVKNRTLDDPNLRLRRVVPFFDTYTLVRPQYSPQSYDGGCCVSISNNAEVPDANLHSLLSSEKCRLTSSALFFSSPYDEGRPSRSVLAGNYTDLNRMRSSFSRGIRQKERTSISDGRTGLFGQVLSYARLSLLGIGSQGRSGVRAFLFHDNWS